MTARLRIGIVGADAKGQGWAPIAHFPALRSLPDYEIVALCTAHVDTAAAAAARYGVGRAFHDYHAMVAAPDIDLVSVVVRAPNHHKVVMAALRADKNVYCEWPLGVSTAQAEQMAALARETGMRAMVGLQARADPTLRYMRDLVAQGYVGDVLAVNMVMMTAGVLEHPLARVWERDKTNGVSTLTIRGMHSLDALCFCLGEFAELSARVSTQVKQRRVAETGEILHFEIPDNILVNGTLRNGAVVAAHIATLPYNTPGWRMEVYGRNGTLQISTSGAPQRDANALRGSQGRVPLVQLPVPAHYTEVPSATPTGPPHNVAHLYMRIAKAIRANAAVEPDFELALARHRLIDAIEQSSDERRTIELR